MQINELTHGFRVRQIRGVPDCGGVLYEMEHERSGARLLWLEREDQNMTFAITFQTTPTDDTGVFHILEHSVLNGSEKYPVREPFVDLLKSSLQTFLNAMTYPDKTMYPVSSRNRKDFMNLTSVYLDAVFRPRIYQEPNIFRQEGWHYEIRDPEDAPAYKGVVHSEMKGSFSSVDTVLVNELNRLLYPDNCYQYISGGDPECITDLTYEQFLETHRKYYHPSNSRIILDGSVDIDEMLAFIDDEYLSQYDRIDPAPPIRLQEPVKACSSVIPYEVGEDEGQENMVHVALAKIISRYDDIQQNAAWSVLSQILVGTNESPFKKAVIDAGLGQDVELELYDGIQQPWAVLVIRNTDEDKADLAVKTVIETARKTVENGLDHEEILASLNQLQFQYLEPREPAGLMYVSSAMNSWLYDGDPMLYLNANYVFDELREKLKEGYFEQLLRDFLLDEEHLVRVTAVPDPSLAAQRAQKEAEKLERAAKTWDEETVSRLVRENLALDEWQNTEDTPEQKASLPSLKLEDIDTDFLEPRPEKITEYHGAQILSYPAERSGIVYLNLYFSLAGVKIDELSAVNFFAGLFRSLPTENYSVQQLQSRIRRDLGALGFSADVYRAPADTTACLPVFNVFCSVLEKNLEQAKELILEVLQKTVFDRNMILPLLKQEQEYMRQAMIANGQALAGLRTAAHITADGAAREALSGYTYSRFINDFANHFDERIDEMINEFELYREVLFSRARLTISCTGREGFDTAQELIMDLPYSEAHRSVVHYPRLETGNEAILIPSQVGYSAMAGALQNAGDDYRGIYRTASQILTYGYLWNEVRVKNGAYGTAFTPGYSGLITCSSYRDPNPANSLNVFRKCGDYLKQFAQSDQDLTSYVIGALNTMDPLLSPSAKIRVADGRVFTNLTPEKNAELREQLLKTSMEDLSEAGGILNRMFEDAVFCIVGPQELIDSCADEDLTVYSI